MWTHANEVWESVTEVWGSARQMWGSAKEVWGSARDGHREPRISGHAILMALRIVFCSLPRTVPCNRGPLLRPPPPPRPCVPVCAPLCTGAFHLANALKGNTTVTALDLGNNCLGHRGAWHVAASLSSNNILQVWTALGTGPQPCSAPLWPGRAGQTCSSGQSWR